MLSISCVGHLRSPRDWTKQKTTPVDSEVFRKLNSLLSQSFSTMRPMSNKDTLQSFLFDGTDVRGEINTLTDSYQEIMALQQYPLPVACLFGEFLAAASLIAASLKYAGMVTVQATGDGPISAVMAECTAEQKVRGIVRGNITDFKDTDSHSLEEVLGRGTLAVTIEPDKGERYQGVVAMDADNLSGCLEHYFSQSAQLPTMIKLAASAEAVSGMLIQQMPVSEGTEKARVDWQHLTTLLETLKSSEQLDLSHNDQLYRLFHQDNVRLFQPKTISFNCSCSETRTAQALIYLGRDELLETIAEQGVVSVTCQFCAQQYEFNEAAIKALFHSDGDVVH